MHLYRFHFLDLAGTVTRHHSVQLPTDAAAIKVGQRMFADRNQDFALEIWHLSSLIYYENRPPSLTATAITDSQRRGAQPCQH